VLADRPRRPATFLLLGSASPDLWRNVTESLAGRVAFHDVNGFGLDEVKARSAEQLWLRGGFPRSFLAPSEAESLDWRRHFIETFLGRDLPGLGFSLPKESVRRLWTMLAHLHGQPVNLHKLGASLGVSHMTVRRWIDILMGTFVVRALQPWSENVGKRLVRSPKLYIADTGLLHSLLDVETSDDLHAHPSVGASWESFAISQVTRCLGARPEQCFFYATHAGAELDLLVVRGRERLGFEIKRTAAPSATKSMRIAVDDLRLKRLDVIHAGSRTFPLDEHIRAVALHRLWRDLDAGGHR
jgi:predicted AAA+ superfamily ATPase